MNCPAFLFLVLLPLVAAGQYSAVCQPAKNYTWTTCPTAGLFALQGPVGPYPAPVSSSQVDYMQFTVESFSHTMTGGCAAAYIAFTCSSLFSSCSPDGSQVWDMPCKDLCVSVRVLCGHESAGCDYYPTDNCTRPASGSVYHHHSHRSDASDSGAPAGAAAAIVAAGPALVWEKLRQ
jgi:hypothetical protein